MINIGKKLIGEDAAKYLPFALTKARQFAATFANAYISRTFVVDTATVMVEVFNKDQAQVTIWGGGGGYEFFCTGEKLTKSTAYGGIPVYLGSAVRVTLKEENGVQTLKATPIGSTLLESPEKKWDYSIDPTAMPDTYLAKGGWQVQGISEFVTFPKLKAKVALTSAWCAASDIGGCNQRGFSFGIASETNGYDVFYDSAPSKLNSGASGGTDVVPDADWYRRATLATVEDPKYGNRTFFLMTTISGDLVVYTDTERDNAEADGSPYAAQQIKTNIPAKYAKTIAIPMPSNARKPAKKARDTLGLQSDSIEQRRHALDFPQSIWKFNSDGTRMACAAFYMAEEVRLGGAPVKMLEYGYQEIPMRDELPGLVEIAINVKITGPNKEDFTVGLEIVRDMDPFITSRVFLHCDYSWKISAIAKPSDPAEPFDLEAINPYEQKKDNLLVAEIEVFKEKGAITLTGEFYKFGWDGALLHHMQSDLLIKNLTLGTELHRFPLVRPACKRNQRAKTFWHDSAVVIAIDLRIMAWVLQRDIIQVNSSKPELIAKVREDYDDAGDYSNNWWRNDVDGYHYDEITRATKLETWVYNKIEEEQYLSPSSPLNDLIDSRAKGEGLQPSQDRKRFEKVIPSDTMQLDAAFPFNKNGYSIPDPTYRDQYGNPDTTIVYEETEEDARNAYLNTGIWAPPIVCTMFGRQSLYGAGMWNDVNNCAARAYGEELSRSYDGFGFVPAVWSEGPANDPAHPRVLRKSGAISVGAGFSPLPLGAYAYNAIGMSAMMMVVNDGFTIHPDGHWAISTSPTISYDGPTTTDIVRVPERYGYRMESVAKPGFGAASFSTDLGKFVQGYVDIISIKSKTGRLRTSHLKQYNKAFDKEDTVRDYLVKLSKTTGLGQFMLYGVYYDEVWRPSRCAVNYSIKYETIDVDMPGIGKCHYIVSPLMSLMASLDIKKNQTGEDFPEPNDVVHPATKALLSVSTRYRCGALIDFRPSYLLSFLGPDRSDRLPGVMWTTGDYHEGGVRLTYERISPNATQGVFYEASVLAGSRIFYGELKGTVRVDHEDDK